MRRVGDRGDRGDSSARFADFGGDWEGLNLVVILRKIPEGILTFKGWGLQLSGE